MVGYEIENYAVISICKKCTTDIEKKNVFLKMLLLFE